MLKKIIPLLLCSLMACSISVQKPLSDDFVGCKITLEQGLNEIQRIKTDEELDFEIRIVKEITDNKECLGMIMGTNVPQGDDLLKIVLLDLVVGITDPDREFTPEDPKEIQETEDEFYLLKLKEINKEGSNLMNKPLFGGAIFEIEISGHGVISHIDEVKELRAYSYVYSEQCGKIYGLQKKDKNAEVSFTLHSELLVDLSKKIDCGNEKGLHTFNSIEINNKNYLLVTYLRNDFFYMLSAFEVFNDSSISQEENILIEFPVSDLAKVHFGGKIIKKDNSKFTLCLGDLNSAGSAAKFDSPWGKILEVSNTDLLINKITSINDSRLKIIAHGFRNPWSCYFAGKDLIIPDVGNIHWEEFNVIVDYKNSKEPPFYGWPWKEGYFDANYTNQPVDIETKNSLLSNMVEPLYTFPHAEGYCAIIGGVQIKNNLAWKDFGLVGDFCTGTIWAVEHIDKRAYKVLDTGKIPFQLTTIYETTSGEVLVGTTNGNIIRVLLP